MTPGCEECGCKWREVDVNPPPPPPPPTERDLFRAQVRDALWAEFRRQAESDNPFAPYVGDGIIDGEVDMDAAAEAAIAVMVERLAPPF